MTAVIKYAIIAVLLTLMKSCSAANIVILGLPMYSHLAGLANVGEFLQSQGHNVLLAIPPQLKEKLKKHDVKLLLYNCLGDFPENRSYEDLIKNKYFAGRSMLHSLLFAKGKDDPTEAIRSILTKIVQDNSLREDIGKFKPELIIIDSTSLATMLTLIPYKMHIPFVMMGCTEFAQYTRTPILPTVFPFELGLVRYTDQMTFPQRLFNTLLQLFSYRHNLYANWSLVSEYAPEISLMDVPAKAELWIITQHSVFDYNRPLMPNVKRVGQLLTATAKPLPKELQSFVESADNGIVVVSFGSILVSVPPEVKYKLLAAFKQTKYKFIVQSSLQHKNQSDQFISLTWLPQFDLLRHPKTKLFITHCGSHGLQEALIAGVPIIGFPVFGDQPHNAGKVVRKGYGLKLELRSFSVQELVSAIEEVITNPSYKAKVEKASAIIKSERVPPVEEAAYWINHVLTFGSEHLRSYAQDIPLWKYLGLDIIACCLVMWHMFVYLIVKILKCCFSNCLKRKQKLKDE